jgi:hypothetical protein
MGVIVTEQAAVVGVLAVLGELAGGPVRARSKTRWVPVARLTAAKEVGNEQQIALRNTRSTREHTCLDRRWRQNGTGARSAAAGSPDAGLRAEDCSSTLTASHGKATCARF